MLLFWRSQFTGENSGIIPHLPSNNMRIYREALSRLEWSCCWHNATTALRGLTPMTIYFQFQLTPAAPFQTSICVFNVLYLISCHCRIFWTKNKSAIPLFLLNLAFADILVSSLLLPLQVSLLHVINIFYPNKNSFLSENLMKLRIKT